MSSILSRAEEERARVRTLLDVMRVQVAELKDGGGRDALSAALSQLTSELGLGTAPELERCPRCDDLGMRGARLCSSCWSPLPAAPG